jgi:hypothetical protein
MPAAPAMLAISWGSVTAVVTPCGTTARANCGGLTIVDSTWMWCHQAGDEGRAVQVNDFFAGVAVAHRRDGFIGQGHVRLQHFAGEDVDHASVCQQHVGRFIARATASKCNKVSRFIMGYSLAGGLEKL